jgi:hypothetical protein
MRTSLFAVWPHCPEDMRRRFEMRIYGYVVPACGYFFAHVSAQRTLANVGHLARPFLSLLISLPHSESLVPGPGLFNGRNDACERNKFAENFKALGRLHGEKACESEVRAREQGSFDCAFPRWRARMLRSR